MKDLYQLAECNIAYRSIIELLIPQEKSSPLRKLYCIVFEVKNLDDKEVLKMIYKNGKLTSFVRLKARLTEILIKTSLLHFSALEAEHSRVNEVIGLFRNTLASMFLTDQNRVSIAIRIAEKALRKSLKYHSTENILLLTRLLIRIYSASLHDRKKLFYYLELQSEYMRIYSWEVKAENYAYELQNINSTSLGPLSLDMKQKAKEYAEELNKVKDIQSYLFITSKYKVKAAYYEFNRDYESLLKLSEETINEINTPYIKTNYILRSINLRKIWALIQAGRNSESIVISNEYLRPLPEGSFSWYLFSHYKLKALIYSKEYFNSAILISDMINNPEFPKLGDSFKEIFKTTLSYMHLVADSAISADAKKCKRMLPEFKIGKFLNDVPIFAKDKKGINVSILLMHIAFLLQRKKYDEIIDRTDSLNQYAYKYLRKDDTFRSNCMIKMVIQMTKAGFNLVRTERYTKDLFRQLEQVKLAGSGENIETEIIPYEVLWDIMKRALK